MPAAEQDFPRSWLNPMNLPPLFRLWTACAGLLLPALPASVHGQRQMETLGRGLVASRTGNTSAHVSWRWLGDEPADAAFHLYRSRGAAAPVRVNATPIVQTTDFRDNGADFSQSVHYHVRMVRDGVEGPPSPAFTLPAGAPVRQFIPVPIEPPPPGVTPANEAYTYLVNDISVGDLDGDGEYEFVVRWDPSNAKDNSQSGYTGPVFMDAYTLAGSRLWRIDLGKNIRAGAHYTQFMVYDLDGNGRAELAMKTAPGTLDGQGNPVLLPGHNAQADYRNASGYILSGPEYLTVFDGLSGAALATVPYLVPRHPSTENPSGSQLNSVWGDSYGNRVDRFLAGVAYLDGQRPSLVFSRGYYTRTAIAAWDWRDGVLSLRWLFDTHGNSALNSYRGQGNHQLAIADADGDGRDEIIFGAMVINDDGTGLHSTGLGHGDALHVSDFDPDRPGLEIFQPHESPGGNGGIGTSFRDAATGAILWSTPASSDVGRGCMMDIDPRFPGAEGWATNSDQIFSAAGGVVGPRSNAHVNFGVWWDAGLEREMLDNTTIARWNWASGGGRTNLLTAWQMGAAASNGTKSTPAISGDLFGDWREEVVWKNSDSTALLIFTTTIPATNRLRTLLHDPTYRLALAWQNVAYNQPPHPGFFLGHDMPAPPRPPLWHGGLVWRGGHGAQSWNLSSPRFRSSPIAQDALVYTPGERVLFDGSGHAGGPVRIDAAVSPAEIVVHNPRGHDYHLEAGSGSLQGAGGLTKSGHGRLTLSGHHSLSGPLVINQGEFHLAGDLPACRLRLQGLGSLSGGGTVAELITEKRATLRLGSPQQAAGSLSILGNALLDGCQWDIDLPAHPAAGNDRLVITGNLTLAGLNQLRFHPPEGLAAAPGVYPLATFSGSLTGDLSHLSYDPSFSALENQLLLTANTLSLVISPPPPVDELVWSGLGNQWDLISTHWRLGETPRVFAQNDAVRFDASGAAAPVVALQGGLFPSSLRVDAPGSYQFTGPGTIEGEGPWLKTGTGNLTVSMANPRSGPTVIEQGSIILGHANALGSGEITLAGGTWATGTHSPPNPILVATHSTLSGGHSGGTHGVASLRGAPGVRLDCIATNVFDFEGSLAAFEGTLALGGTGSFRLFNNASNASSATIDLGTRTLSTRSGSAFRLGALAGLAGSRLNGANGYTSAVTYTLGENQRDSHFAGTITDGTGATHLTKVGSGTLVLAGNASHSGQTRVRAGTLQVDGSLSASPLTVEENGRLTGIGNLAAAVICQGILEPGPGLVFQSGLHCESTASLRFQPGSHTTPPHVGGPLVLAGSIEISPAPATRPGSHTLLTYGSTLSLGGLDWSVDSADFLIEPDLSVPGEIRIRLLSTLDPFTLWQQEWFGSADLPVAQAAEDPDGDGQTNQAEFLAGTHPLDPTSRFSARLVADADGFVLYWPSRPDRLYEIQHSDSLQPGSWQTIATLPGQNGSSHSSHPLPPAASQPAFYRILARLPAE